MSIIYCLEESFKEISQLIQFQDSLELSGLQNTNNCSGDDVKKVVLM